MPKPFWQKIYNCFVKAHFINTFHWNDDALYETHCRKLTARMGNADLVLTRTKAGFIFFVQFFLFFFFFFPWKKRVFSKCWCLGTADAGGGKEREAPLRSKVQRKP